MSDLSLDLKKVILRLRHLNWEFFHLDRRNDYFDLVEVGLDSTKEKLYSHLGFLVYTAIEKQNLTSLDFSDLEEINSYFEEELSEISNSIKLVGAKRSFWDG